ncbi:MAG TPA: flagellar motor stator protein MotA [Terriglobales bacterium]|nr:flagellar motor stator protein MotA [Terriglobales bacterium]
MFVIIGLLVVFGAVLGGYLLEHGRIAVLLQPAELLIIGGAGIGTVLIANPLHVLKKIVSGVIGSLKPSRFGKQRYLETLKLCYEILNKARREGLMGLESDVEDPGKSQIFSKHAWFLKDHHTRDFVCDTMRMAITGGVDPFDLDQMMESDIEVSHHEASVPVAALSTMADSLPGLGIVAAVLGVVITMGALGGPPEEIGQKVAAALVGTFLGILMCYGFVGPVASNMAKSAEEENQYHNVLRIVLLSFIKGNAPIQALEFGRRAIPGRVRPTFQEMESTAKGANAAAAQGK